MPLTKSVYIYRAQDKTYLRFVGDTADEANASVTFTVNGDGQVEFTPAVKGGSLDHLNNLSADPKILKRIWTDVVNGVNAVTYTSSVKIQPEGGVGASVELLASELATKIKSLITLIPGVIKAETQSFEIVGLNISGDAIAPVMFKVNNVEIDPTRATLGQVLTYNGTKFMPTDAASGGIIEITYADASALVSGTTGLKPGAVYKVSAGPKNTTSIGSIILQAVSKTQFLNTGYILSNGTYCEVSYDFASDICYAYQDPRGNSLSYSLSYANAHDPVFSFPRADATKSDIVVTPESSNYAASLDITAAGSTVTINSLPALDAGLIQLTTTATPTAPATTVVQSISSISRLHNSSRPVRFKSTSGLSLVFKSSATLKTEAGLNTEISGLDWIEFTLDSGVWLQSNISTY